MDPTSSSTRGFYVVCEACKRPYREHHKLKCLFGPGHWTAVVYVERYDQLARLECVSCDELFNVDVVAIPTSCPYCKAVWIYQELPH